MNKDPKNEAPIDISDAPEMRNLRAGMLKQATGAVAALKLMKAAGMMASEEADSAIRTFEEKARELED